MHIQTHKINLYKKRTENAHLSLLNPSRSITLTDLFSLKIQAEIKSIEFEHNSNGEVCLFVLIVLAGVEIDVAWRG